MREFLLRSFKGENIMLKDLSCLHDIDVNTQDEKWCFAGLEYGINPFGKLVKQAQKQIINKKNGKAITIQHKKYHHGFYMNLTCSEKFYNDNKDMLDKYILTEERKKELNINPEIIPAWF